MKFKTTKKAINANYKNVFEIGFCNAQHLLFGLEPIAYTSGVYGWNADIYEINSGTAIVTGYRPFGNIRPDYKTIKEYETAAEAIVMDHADTYENKLKRLHNLRADFIGTILNS